MAGGSLLTLLDDIATLLDDVALMAKVAAKKTAGVLGDDLALNAQQVTGVNADRELPVVAAVAKGSFINKLILVPVALAISALAPWLITPLLMLGGAFLCFEGVEKLAHKLLHKKDEAPKKAKSIDDNIDLAAFEKDKIRGAIRTDFILSAEIIVITLGTVATANFIEQITVLAIIAVTMTLGVYGLVAGIVKLDDLGLYMSNKRNPLAVSVGGFIVKAAPYLMKSLSVIGTVAMFMVGGGILTHGLSGVHNVIEDISLAANAIPTFGALLGDLTSVLLNIAFGIAVGAVALAIVTLAGSVKKRFTSR